MKTAATLLILLLVAAAAGPSQASTGLEANHTVRLQRHAAGTFYVDASIDGFGDVQLLVDTGSSFLSINQTILSELLKNGTARYVRDIDGHLADNSRLVVPIYRISRLRLGPSCWLHDVDAAAFPADTRPILGMRPLERLAPFTFSAAPAALGLSHCQDAQATTDISGL